MASPSHEHDIKLEEERARLGAALAALSRRVPEAMKHYPSQERPAARDEPMSARPFTPWSRHARPLYKF